MEDMIMYAHQDGMISDSAFLQILNALFKHKGIDICIGTESLDKNIPANEVAESINKVLSRFQNKFVYL